MEEKLFDLLEAKTFNELTEVEVNFVLSIISKEEYDLQRNVIFGLSEVKPEPMVAQPIILPTEKKRIVVPLWQVLVGAACMLIGFVLIYPKLETISSNNSASENLVVDTLIVQKVDTIFLPSEESETKIVYQTDTIRIVEKVPFRQNDKTENNTFFTNNSPKNQGTSLKDDRDLGWVPKQIAL